MTAFTRSNITGKTAWHEVKTVWYKTAKGWVEVDEGWRKENGQWLKWWPDGGPGPDPVDYAVTTFAGRMPTGETVGVDLTFPRQVAWSNGGRYAFVGDEGQNVSSGAPAKIYRWDRQTKVVEPYAAVNADPNCFGSSVYTVAGARAHILEAPMRASVALAVGADNSIYFATRGQIMFTPGSPMMGMEPSFAYTVAGNNVLTDGKSYKGSNRFGYVNATGEQALFADTAGGGSFKGGLAVDDVDKCLYFADTFNHAIRRISIDPATFGATTTAVGDPNQPTQGTNDNPDPLLARLRYPSRLGIWGNWLVISSNSTIRGFRLREGDDGFGENIKGEVITMLGGTAKYFTGVGLSGEARGFGSSLDGTALFVADTNRVLELNLTRMESTVFTGAAGGYVNGALKDARFNTIKDLSIHPQSGALVLVEDNKAGRLISK